MTNYLKFSKFSWIKLYYQNSIHIKISKWKIFNNWYNDWKPHLNIIWPFLQYFFTWIILKNICPKKMYYHFLSQKCQSISSYSLFTLKLKFKNCSQNLFMIFWPLKKESQTFIHGFVKNWKNQKKKSSFEKLSSCAPPPPREEESPN